MWYLLKRGLQMLVILGMLSAALFGLLTAMPGNPVDLLITSNPQIKPEDVMRLKKLRGLDKPWYVQYGRWLWGYPEPARPPQILALPVLKLPKSQGLKTLSVDLGSMLVDPNFVPSSALLTSLLDQLWPVWQKDLIKNEIKAALERPDLPALMSVLAQHDPTMQNRLVKLIERQSAKDLSIAGLFGATTSAFVLSKTFEDYEPLSALWFVVSNAYGQQRVGKVAVRMPKDKRGRDLLRPISTQMLDQEDEPFMLDLNKFILDPKRKGHLSYELVSKDGTLSSDGIYAQQFRQAGQSVVSFRVRDRAQHQDMAFDIEHGVLGHQTRFNRGLLFFFVGDQNALGFSQTYKRPIYDLLFGEKVLCGDGRVDATESCDDGNLVNGDGCSASCFKDDEGLLSKISTAINGFISRSGRIGNTIQLMLPALLFSLLVAIPLGIISACRQYSWLDYAVNFLAFIGISLPVFWFGIMMIYLFAEKLAIFPAGGIQTPGIYAQGTGELVLDRLNHAILPTLVLSIFYIGRWLRYMRASMLEVLPSDYVRTARAKGLSEWVVIMKHAFRNALIPVVTVLAISIPSLFGGAVLTETVFSWPGIGRLQYEAVMNSDYYVAIIVFLVSAVLVMVGNLLADVLYILVDPRIRKS